MSLALPGLENLEEIGRGGSGIVNRAWQPEFGRWVAVKVFAVGEDVRRLERERLAVGRLSDHPGIVPVFDGGQTPDGRPYLIMGLMEGGSLADRVRDRGPVPPGEVVALGAALASALQVAHDLGVLHRDLKPANILFDRFGAPRLADFGIAHLGDDGFRTEAGLMSGTIAYMAPELLDGHPYTPAADVFSLGATLYFALQGRHLFEPRPQEPYAAFVMRRITAPHAPEFFPGVPARLRDVIVAATDPQVARRIPTAEALRAALAGVGPAISQPLPASQPLPPSPQPWPAPAPSGYTTVAGHAAPRGYGPPPMAGPPPGAVPGPPWGTPAFGGVPVEPGVPRPSRGRNVLLGVAMTVVIGAGAVLWVKGTDAATPHAQASGSGTGRPVSGSASPGAPRTARSGTAVPPASPSGVPSSDVTVPGDATGPASVLQAVDAFRAAAGGGDPGAVELLFYPYPEGGSGGAYAIASLPQRAHPNLVDRYTYRDGAVGDPEPVPGAADPRKVWNLSAVTWTSTASMFKSADAVCRAAMFKAGLPDQPDTFGRKAGITHVMVERDTVFNAGKVIVRVYFGGGARWTGGYVPFSATGKVLSTRYCTVDS